MKIVKQFKTFLTLFLYVSISMQNNLRHLKECNHLIYETNYELLKRDN